MNNTLLKSIVAGLLLGVALFMVPFFLIRLLVFVLVISALFRLFGRGHFRRGWQRDRGFGYSPAFTDRIRQMSDEEYSQFRQRFGYDRSGHQYEAQKSTEDPNNQPNNS